MKNLSFATMSLLLAASTGQAFNSNFVHSGEVPLLISTYDNDCKLKEESALVKFEIGKCIHSNFSLKLTDLQSGKAIVDRCFSSGSGSNSSNIWHFKGATTDNNGQSVVEKFNIDSKGEIIHVNYETYPAESKFKGGEIQFCPKKRAEFLFSTAADAKSPVAGPSFLSQDGRYYVIAATTGDASVKFFNTTTGKITYRFADVNTLLLKEENLSSDSEFIVLPDFSGPNAKLYQVSTQKVLAVLESQHIAFSPDNNYLVEIGFGMKVYDLKNKAKIVYQDSNLGVYGLDGATGGSRLIFTSDSKYVLGLGNHNSSYSFFAYDLAAKKLQAKRHVTLPQSTDSSSGYAVDLILSPDSKYLLGLGGIAMTLLDIQNDKLIRFLGTDQQDIIAAVFSADGQYVIQYTEDDLIRVHAISSGAEVFREKSGLTAPNVGFTDFVTAKNFLLKNVKILGAKITVSGKEFSLKKL